MASPIRLVAGVDYKKLPLTPAEGNVFSKIDGKATVDDIIRLTGFHPDTVAKAVERLVELGAAEVLDQARIAKDQVDKTTKAAASMAFGGALGQLGTFDQKLLDEAVDLDVDKKKQILDAFGRLEKLSFYELLGLHQLVDRKEVKAAYYAIAPEFHPDKFFKRNLGSFKGKIEAVFARLTLAHDTLTAKQKRAEYDEYLKTFEANRKASEILSQAQAAIASAQATIEQQARAAAGVAADGTDARKAQDLADKRRALAAKLGKGRYRAEAKPEEKFTPPPMDPKAAAEALRVRYEYAKQEAQRTQIEHYVASGRRAIAAAEWAAAANYFKIASSIAPNDANVQKEAAEVASLAATALADNFARQGDFELQQERYMEAAVSFSKACQGRPEDPKLHERAAFATFRSNNNPRRAVELARRAVELAPNQTQMRITLAYCFMSAGFESSANAELDRAAEMVGKDAKGQALVAAARDAVKQHMIQLFEQEKLAAQAPPSMRKGASGEVSAQRGFTPQPTPSQRGLTPGLPGQSAPGSMPPYQQPSHAPPAGSQGGFPAQHGYPQHHQTYPPQHLPTAPPPQASYPPQGSGHPGPYPPHQPQAFEQQQGYQQQGYQEQGYQHHGYQQQGYQQEPTYPPQGHAPSAYPAQPSGYPPGQSQAPYPQHPQQGQSAYPAHQQGGYAQGYPPQGYPQQGYPQQGYQQHGGYPPAPSGHPPQPSHPVPPDHQHAGAAGLRLPQPSAPQIHFSQASHDPAVHTRPTPPQPMAPPQGPEPSGAPVPQAAPGQPHPRMSGAYSVVNPAVVDRRPKR